MLKEVELIIIAMDEEMESLLDRLNGKLNKVSEDNQEYYSFEINNRNFILTRGKIGKVATAFYIGKLSNKFNIKRIYNLGTSGAYQNHLKIGDVVIASKVEYFDVDVTGFGYEYGHMPQCPKSFVCEEVKCSLDELSNSTYKVHTGLIGSSDSFITQENREVFPLSKINPMCVEMESGAVGQCAYLLNIPFIVIRSISDKVYHDENYKVFDNNLKLASDNCVDVLLKLIS